MDDPQDPLNTTENGQSVDEATDLQEEQLEGEAFPIADVLNGNEDVVNEPDPSTEEYVVTEPIPTTTESVATEPIPTTAESVSTEPIPTTAESVATEPIPTTGESVATEPIPTTAESVATEPIPTTAESVATEPIPTTAESVVTTTESTVAAPISSTSEANDNNSVNVVNDANNHQYSEPSRTGRRENATLSSFSTPTASLASSTMECVVCSDSFPRLKLLTCGHSFCPDCLERIQRGITIRCPYCRCETELSPFGVPDLPGQYCGNMDCGECSNSSEMKDALWCKQCKNILCKEYVLQLGEALERQLDEDLDNRIRYLKLEKQRLKDVFEMDASPHPNPIPVVPLPNGPQFAFILNEVYKLAPHPGRGRPRSSSFGDLGSIPKEGLIFNPFALDKTVESFLKMDKFAQFGTSFKSLIKPGKERNPVNYIGAGQLDNPCDLVSIPEEDILAVSCIDRGLFAFKFSTGELLRVIPPVNTEQFTGLAYETKHKLYLVSTLRHYHKWVIKLFDQRLKFRQEVPCPVEPRISNNWYRWLCPIKEGRVLMTTGDQNQSAIWLLDLNANRWKQLWTKEGVTLRKATYNPGKGSSGMIYIPDMNGRNLITFHIDTDAWELTKESKIVTAEFTKELPIAVEISDNRLIVGNWYSGNVIVADLSKCSSTVLTSVGEKELFSLHSLHNNRLALLCKEKEVVQVYKLSGGNPD